MPYHHLNTLTVFPEKLAHNFSVLSSLHHDINPVPVLKSNAYGHGMKIIAPLLHDYDVPFVCVDSLYEAYELKKYGYKKDILIMGYVDPRDIPRRRNFIYAISDLDYATALIKHSSRVRLHLFLDTGMHREGIADINTDHADAVLTKIAPRIEGVMSHFSTPDNRVVTETQIASFEEQLGILRKYRIYPRYTHIAASGGLLAAHTYREISGSIARCGLAFYGYGSPELQPALRLTTHLIQIKNIKKGETVGYDGTFIAPHDMKIGVLPIGYHDGIDRRLSGVGVVMIRGQVCPIIGRVSMNITTIDLSSIDAQEGDEVLIIDENRDSPVSLLRQSERANMIPYDMLVHLSKEMYRTIS